MSRGSCLIESTCPSILGSTEQHSDSQTNDTGNKPNLALPWNLPACYNEIRIQYSDQSRIQQKDFRTGILVSIKVTKYAWSWVLAPFYIHQMNRVNSRNGSACHDDSIVNITIIIIMHVAWAIHAYETVNHSKKNRCLQISQSSSVTWSPVGRGGIRGSDHRGGIRGLTPLFVVFTTGTERAETSWRHSQSRIETEVGMCGIYFYFHSLSVRFFEKIVFGSEWVWFCSVQKRLL